MRENGRTHDPRKNMAKVRDIIRSAYRTCQVLGEGQQLTGDELREGLILLNESVQSFNLQQFLPWTRSMLQFDPAGRQAIIIQPVEDTDERKVVPETDKVWHICREPARVIAPVPVRIESLLYATGINWIPITEVGFSDLQKYILNGTNSIPSAFAYERGYAGEEDGQIPYGIIYLNRATPRGIRCVYNKLVKPYDVNDMVDAPAEYEQLFRYDVALRLAQQKMFPDDIESKITRRKNEVESLIKDVNSHSHLLTYEDGGPSEFYNILAPWQWTRLR